MKMLLLFTFALATACSEASIEGEIFVVNQAGDAKPAAGTTVYLLPTSGATTAEVNALCERRATAMRTAADEYSRAMDKRLYDAAETLSKGVAGIARIYDDSIRQVFVRAAAAEAPSGAAGRFSFADVGPGTYDLFSDWQVGGQTAVWWNRVEVARGEKIRRDLTNAQLIQHYCSPK